MALFSNDGSSRRHGTDGRAIWHGERLVARRACTRKVLGQSGRANRARVRACDGCGSNFFLQLLELLARATLQHLTLTTHTMGAMKRKADQASTPAKKDKGDRNAKRRKSDVTEQPSPANAKPETAAPPKSIFKDEEKAFPRGGASVLTPLEHKQIQIKANQDVLFEASGGKRTGNDGFSDMGSDDGESAAPKAVKKKAGKKGKKSHDSGEPEEVIRAEGLNFKVGLLPRMHGMVLTAAETGARHPRPRPDHRYLPPGSGARPPQQPRRIRAAHRRLGQAERAPREAPERR
jgi:hypothetical protein